jgi:hypothetical protein
MARSTSTTLGGRLVFHVFVAEFIRELIVARIRQAGTRLTSWARRRP